MDRRDEDAALIGACPPFSAPSGAAAREELASQLRRLRELAGVSGRQLARRLDISQSRLSRIETGSSVPSLPQVAAWCAELGVSNEVREALIRLTEGAHSEITQWRPALSVRAHLQDDVQAREESAHKISSFQPSLVPGLLQTAEYARRVFSLFQLPYATEGLSAAVAARLHRQHVLYNVDKRFDFLIAEAALRWRPGPAHILLAQLDRVASISTLENVSIGFIPQDVELTTTIPHGFVIYDSEDDSTVSFETIHASILVRSSEDVKLYRERWDLLRQMAIYDQPAQDLIAALRAELRRPLTD
ncbi:helix-turn-helix domain-containing protein [Nocardia gipuzkoensis]